MPTPVSPVISEQYQDQEHVYAKGQPQYRPLPVMRNSQGVLLSRWRLSDEERAAISSGADIFLYNWTFNQLLQPVRIEIGEVDSTIEEKGYTMEVVSKSLDSIDKIMSEAE